MTIQTQNSINRQDLIEAISWMLKIPSSQIFPYTHLQDDLELDPIDRLLLIAQLERSFNVFLNHEDEAAIETVADAGFYLQRRQEQA